MATEVHEPQTPGWVRRMREAGFTVREAQQGATFCHGEKPVRQASPLVAAFRRAVRRLRGGGLP